jgi:CHAT domain-containing protein
LLDQLAELGLRPQATDMAALSHDPVQLRNALASEFANQRLVFQVTPERFNVDLDSLCENRQLYLVYHSNPRQTWLFVIFGGTTDSDRVRSFYPLQASDKLRDLARGFLDWCHKQPHSGASERVSYDTDLRELLLPAKVLTTIREAKPSGITIVPDGILRELPFEVLPLEDGGGKVRRLFEVLPPISYAPSLTALARLKQNVRVQSGPPSLLAVGPSFTDILAKEEAAALAKDHRATRGLATDLLGERATRAGVLRELSKAPYSWIHFATHASQQGMKLTAAGDAEAQLQSGAVEPAQSEHEMLAVGDISKLPLSGCQLAVLSACGTSTGKEVLLETPASLARAFLAAGANRVVASQWNANDESTRALMMEFYRQLRGQLRAEGSGRRAGAAARLDYALALREARLALLKHKGRRHPYYWGAFILVGPAVGPAGELPSPNRQTARTVSR